MEITKYRSPCFTVSEQVMVCLRQVQNNLRRLERTAADKPQKLREALRARENDLRDLLVSSLDRIAVTDSRSSVPTRVARPVEGVPVSTSASLSSIL
jgi:hypothetical protein